MIPKWPADFERYEVYRPVLDMMHSILLSSRDVAEHWGYKDGYLHQARKYNKGPPWIKLPFGGVRYRASDILAAELAGSHGELTLAKVLVAVSACADVDSASREKIIQQLRAAFEYHPPRNTPLPETGQIPRPPKTDAPKSAWVSPGPRRQRVR